MTINQLKPFIGVNTKTPRVGGQSTVVIPPDTQGGKIINPGQASDQGLIYSEPLYVNQVTDSVGTIANQTTVMLWPGQEFTIPPGQTTATWVSSDSANHNFTAWYLIQSNNPNPIPIPGNLLPDSPVTMTTVIPSYLYKQYDDDNDLQAFVASYNQIGQDFIDTVNGLNLPIYTGDNISGLLLDWVGAGIYGIPRPSLSSFKGALQGPFNTYQFNDQTFNGSELIGPTNIVATSDDTYKRIITWAFLKGDGKVVNIRWLKRRIMRFLIGENGLNPNIDNTDQISITFGPNNEIAIKFIDEQTSIINSAEFNAMGFNTTQFDETNVDITPLTPLPYRDIFQEAVVVGALELPFQFQWTVIL